MAHIIAILTNMLKKEFSSGRRKVKGEIFKQQSDPKFLWDDSDLLIHYNSTKEIFLEIDSSACRLGAVISHEINGEV